MIFVIRSFIGTTGLAHLLQTIPPAFLPNTGGMRVLLTAPSRPPTLALARHLASHGHIVFGAEMDQRFPWISPARWSKTFTRVYNIRTEPASLLPVLPSLDVAIACADNAEEDELEMALLRKIRKLSRAWVISPAQLLGLEGLWREWCDGMDAHIFGTNADSDDEDHHALLEGGVVGRGAIFKAHALITHSCIRTFLVTTSADGLREQDFLLVPAGDAVCDVLFHYLQLFVDTVSQHSSTEIGEDELNTHVSLTFSISERITRDGLGTEKLVKPVRWQGGVHESLILLVRHMESCGGGAWLERAYTMRQETGCLGESMGMPLTIPVDAGLSSSLRGTYSVPRVLLELLQVLWRLGRAPLEATRWREFANLIMMMLVWILWFKEEIWYARDPWPAVVQWAVRTPLESVIWPWELEYFRWRGWMRRYRCCIRVQLWKDKNTRGALVAI